MPVEPKPLERVVTNKTLISSAGLSEIKTKEPVYKEDLDALFNRIAALELSLSSLQTQTALIEQGVIQALNAK